MQHRTMVFMDWSNLWPKIKQYLDNTNSGSETAKVVDYSKLLMYFRRRGFLVGVHIYMVEHHNSEDPELQKKAESVRHFISYLRRTGYRVRTKFHKIFPSGEMKANSDVEIAVDMLSMALRGRVDEVVLGSADSDFRALLETVQDLGVRTVVMGPKKMTSTELRECCDEFLPLESVLKEVLKDMPRKNNAPPAENVAEAPETSEISPESAEE